ncbi:MAG: FlgK family flagellar hook-associated protein [Sandaracinobacter sp.]
MALFDILGVAASGLSAAESGLRTVSNNIANVGSPGYARQVAGQSPLVLGGRVAGVWVQEPQRIADRFLEQAVFRQSAGASNAATRAGYLDRLQTLLGPPGGTGGVSGRMDSIVRQAITLTAGQGEAASGAVLISTLSDATSSMAQLSADMGSLAIEADTEISYAITRANDLLQRVAMLNDTIACQSYIGRDTTGLIDQRNVAVEELSGLLRVETRDMPDLRVTIETASGVMLLDNRVRQIAAPGTGSGALLPDHKALQVHLLADDGSLGPATGEELDASAAGGHIGALMGVRDGAIPAAMDRLDGLFRVLAGRVNAAAAAGTTLPPPASMEGRVTGLVGTDRLGFTGSVRLAVAQVDGLATQSFILDFDALGPAATIDDAVAAINAGLGGAATASFTAGVLRLSATVAGTGIAIGPLDGLPDSRSGVGFSHFFGLNDVLRSGAEPLVPMGLAAGDPHGFGAGERAEIVLRDDNGRLLARQTITGSGGPAFSDLLTEMNGGNLGRYGRFAFDAEGSLAFTPTAAFQGSRLAVATDSTNRFGTGVGLSSLLQLSGPMLLQTAALRQGLTGSGLPLGHLVAQGGAGRIVAQDGMMATAMVDRLTGNLPTAGTGILALAGVTTGFVMDVATAATRTLSESDDLSAMLKDATSRRDSVSGVNVDEELSQMVILQNSYAAAARVMTIAQDMYDVLLNMVR